MIINKKLNIHAHRVGDIYAVKIKNNDETDEIDQEIFFEKDYRGYFLTPDNILDREFCVWIGKNLKKEDCLFFYGSMPDKKIDSEQFGDFIQKLGFFSECSESVGQAGVGDENLSWFSFFFDVNIEKILFHVASDMGYLYPNAPIVLKERTLN